MGAAGDMILSALLDIAEEPESLIAKLNGIGLEGVSYEKRKSEKCGIVGIHVDVVVHGKTESQEDFPPHELEHDTHHSHEHKHEHGTHPFHDHDMHHTHTHEREHDMHLIHSHEHDMHHPHKHEHDTHHPHLHTGLSDITEIISRLNIPNEIKQDAVRIYKFVAEAEACVHGRTVEQIHFHELGNLDAIADIVGVCLLINEFSPDRIVVSPVNTGKGFVRCAHGVLPVPAPATAHILRGVPVYAGLISGELCTPTGAAIIKYFAHSFGEMPLMEVEKIGYGMGNKDFEAANCVRAFFGTSDSVDMANEEIAELSCNLDDMTGEAMGFASEILFENGALDVFTVAAQMKKSRPGYILVCLCKSCESDRFAKLILKHTTTFGVRRNILKRYSLEREVTRFDTDYGSIRVKSGTGFDVEKSKPEYNDVAESAKKHGVDILTVYNGIYGK